ncbi:MAG: histidine phosphatase family protein [Marivita sp.]|uniref:histidine phosphatase family protein n=1 Tax=Marivita sp. TaxID=2003365 RepID=UPI0025C6C86F|nr:histidine phosphatase family protein [Marivita sp.]MCI5112124.1 histidine phosphatase family protein [Marivita sp.]
MRVILIRHGETTTSGHSYAGRSNVPLTPRGHEQAARIAEDLSGLPLTHIFVSSLSRSIDTARPLARQHGLDLRVTPSLVEIDFGVLEGREKGALGVSLRKAHAYRPIPGGEALCDVWDRAGAVIRGLPHAPDAISAVVGHFWINRLIWGRLHGLSFEAACASRAYRPATGFWVHIQCPIAPARQDRDGLARAASL